MLEICTNNSKHQAVCYDGDIDSCPVCMALLTIDELCEEMDGLSKQIDAWKRLVKEKS